MSRALSDVGLPTKLAEEAARRAEVPVAGGMVVAAGGGSEPAPKPK